MLKNQELEHTFLSGLAPQYQPDQLRAKQLSNIAQLQFKLQASGKEAKNGKHSIQKVFLCHIPINLPIIHWFSKFKRF